MEIKEMNEWIFNGIEFGLILLSTAYAAALLYGQPIAAAAMQRFRRRGFGRTR